MRLRLDKLVLSAGLALAMVATSIPAIAGTTTTTTKEQTGLSLNGSTVTMNETDNTKVDDEGAFAKAIKGFVKDGDATVALTGYTGTIKSVPVVTVTAGNATEAGDKVTSEVASDGYTLTNVKAAAPSIKIAVTNEYTKTLTVSVEEQADRTEDQLKEAALTASTADVNYHKSTMNTLASKLEQDEDGLKIVAGEAAAETVDTTGITDFTKAQNVPVTITKEITATYTIDSLGASGYTYDFVLDGGDNFEYQVYKKTTDANGIVNVSTVDSSVVNSTSDVKFTITDLTGEYYVAKKPISTAESLLFGDDADKADNTTQDIAVSDTVTLTVKSAEAPVDQAVLAEFNTVAKANNAKIAGYFTANLSTGNYTDSEVTVKIVKPKDIEALAGEGKTIKYTVIRQHTGMPIEALETNSDGEYITFSSKYFSTFALAYEIVDATTEETEETEEASNATDGTTVADATDATAAAATEAADSTADSSTTSTTASKNTGDNSMMPLFMTTLLLALCAGSLAIYKEKKTN